MSQAAASTTMGFAPDQLNRFANAAKMGTGPAALAHLSPVTEDTELMEMDGGGDMYASASDDGAGAPDDDNGEDGAQYMDGGGAEQGFGGDDDQEDTGAMSPLQQMRRPPPLNGMTRPSVEQPPQKSSLWSWLGFGGGGGKDAANATRPQTRLEEIQQLASEKGRLVERLRRRKMLSQKDVQMSDLCNYEIADLAGMSLSQLHELDSIISKRIKADSSIMFYSRVLVSVASIVEQASKTYPGAFGGADLTDWSAHLQSSVFTQKEFENDLFEIYDRYGDVGTDNPVATLLLHMAAHAYMYAKSRAITMEALQRRRAAEEPSSFTGGAADAGGRSAVPGNSQEASSGAASMLQAPAGGGRVDPAMIGSMPPPPPSSEYGDDDGASGEDMMMLDERDVVDLARREADLARAAEALQAGDGGAPSGRSDEVGGLGDAATFDGRTISIPPPASVPVPRGRTPRGVVGIRQ
jgi:hypothetical protein